MVIKSQKVVFEYEADGQKGRFEFNSFRAALVWAQSRMPDDLIEYTPRHDDGGFSLSFNELKKDTLPA